LTNNFEGRLIYIKGGGANKAGAAIRSGGKRAGVFHLDPWSILTGF
jgi:hypothetical protein